MKPSEAQALIVAAQVHLRTYKNANAALKAAKAELEKYMDDNNVEAVEGAEPGTGARFVSRQNRELLLGQMPDELIVWCARNTVLSGALGKFDELPDDTRAVLRDYVGKTAGTRYVDIFFPPWGTSAQAKKETARANSTASPPPVSIAEERLGRSAAIAEGAAPPKRQERPARRAQPTNQGSGILTCPDHPEREPKESKWGGFYCTGQLEDGYCKWTSKKKAS